MATKRKRKPLTEEQKQALRERLAKAREAKKTKAAVTSTYANSDKPQVIVPSVFLHEHQWVPSEWKQAETMRLKAVYCPECDATRNLIDD